MNARGYSMYWGGIMVRDAKKAQHLAKAGLLVLALLDFLALLQELLNLELDGLNLNVILIVTRGLPGRSRVVGGGGEALDTSAGTGATDLQVTNDTSMQTG